MSQTSTAGSVNRASRRKSERKSQNNNNINNKVQTKSQNSTTRSNKLSERQISLQLHDCTAPSPLPDQLLLRNKDQPLLSHITPRFFTLNRCQTTKERKSRRASDWQLGRSSSVSVAVLRGASNHARPQFESAASAAAMATRGQNVSVLHLRGPSEPWEAVVAGSLRSARGNPPGQRELSPVGWNAGSDAGVYLGRSGWVQVHQHSMDEHRATSTRTHQTASCASVLSTRNLRDMRVRLADCHSASEPGRRRPDSLSLPRGQKEDIHVNSPLLPPYDASSPPPITPIISPPPAFQDLEPSRHRPPLLSRSTVAIDTDSPPQSPIIRYRHRTPSPKSSPRVPKQQSCGAFMARRNRTVNQSSSEEDGCWKASLPRRRASPRARSSDSSSSSSAGVDQDSWGGRVRRSRSLQLPEERPPPTHRPRRHLTKKTMSEESRGRGGLRPEAAAEARVVAEFISRVRSRAAARELLVSRYMQRPEPKPDYPVVGQTYNVCVVGDANTERLAKPPYSVCVVNGRSSRDPGGGCGTPCNPSTCDFWPHCSHRLDATDPKVKSKFENVDIDGYVSIRRTGNQQRAESPRSRSPHVGPSPQNRSPHPSASPQDPIRSSRSPVRETGMVYAADPWRLAPGEARRSGSSTPVGPSRSPSVMERPRRDGTPDSNRSSNVQNNPTSPPTWDHLRSMSLPKSFISHRENQRHSIRRKQEEMPTPTEPQSRTAPVTPVRELSVGDKADVLTQQSYPHSTSAPVLDISHDGEDAKQAELTTGVVSAPLAATPEKSSQDSVVEKLRKSISLRFHKSKENRRGRSLREASQDDNEKGLNESIDKELFRQRDVASERSSPSEVPSDTQTDYRFRLGPLLWRSSKERRRGRELSRGGPCRSADSGIHVERSMAAESSDSRDTDPHEDPDSPLRRNGRGVQRAHSELGGLGGQRLLGWDARRRPRSRRKPGPAHTSGLNEDGPPGPLRRSTSQPLGLDELSPLRKTRASSEEDRGTSEDEALFGSESSLLSLNSGKAPELVEDAAIAEALWDHVAMDARELGFCAGDLIQVHNTTDKEWWWGAAEGRTGWFPSSFVRLRVSQEDTVEDCLAAMAAGSRAAAHLRRTSVSLLSNDQVRSCVVRELLSTERDFVRGLRDVAEGYIDECRRRTDMFTPQQIHAIFSNLEELIEFQGKFLDELDQRVDAELPYRSCVGDVFLRHQGGFRKYSEYCNSYPTATATLQQLYQQPNYSTFFEGCRIMRGLIEIPLDGYLLTPVQRICKYPLQLAELLKYTRPDHEDHVPVKEALSVMRGVAVLVNERKRRMESLEKIATWQARVEGWEGEDLLERSSQLLHQDEVIRVTSGMWTSHISLFLFDHQVVYCKKDLLKRHHLVYKGRMCLDTSEVVDVPDGKDPVLGATVRNAVKIHSLLQDKWLLFCCRSSQSKARWLASLAAERRLVLTDRQDGLELTPAARHLARSRAEKSKLKREGSYGDLSGGRKMGAWFTWGGRKQQPVT